jgi:hypothetical protein
MFLVYPSGMETAQITTRVGSTSRYDRLRRVDGRTREGKYLRQIERELTADLGGPDRISVAQRLLVERVAVDMLRLALLDREMMNGNFSAHDSRVSHALRNSTRLTLRTLGLERVAPTEKTPSLSDLFPGRSVA